MTTIAVTTDSAPRPAGAYSQAVVAHGFVFTAGFGPHHPASGALPDGVAEQTRRTLRNIEAVLREAGLGLDDVVKVTAHLADLGDFAEYDRAYREFFAHPLPARTTVGSQLAGILVEIDVVAAMPECGNVDKDAVED